MAETFRPGDRVKFLLADDYWEVGIVDYVYETNGDLVIRTADFPKRVYERKPYEVIRA